MKTREEDERERESKRKAPVATADEPLLGGAVGNDVSGPSPATFARIARNSTADET